MKKIISVLLLCVLLVGSVFTLASCGKMLSGSYKAEALGVSTEYTFKGSKVTITYGALGFEKSVEGKYKIGENDEGKTVITFTFENENDETEKYSGEYTFAEGKNENGVKYIKIGLVTYNKVEK